MCGILRQVVAEYGKDVAADEMQEEMGGKKWLGFDMLEKKEGGKKARLIKRLRPVHEAAEIISQHSMSAKCQGSRG